MSDFDSDVMDEMIDGADEFEDEFDTYDDVDELDDDPFIGRLLGGLFGGNQADAFDEFDDMEAGDDMDVESFEDAVADALDTDDSDEFFRRIARVARGIGRGIGRVARVVAPIASMIPIPQAQLIGRIAGAAGRLLADGADEFEAIDELVEQFDEDALDAAAPVIAGLAVRRAVPRVATMPRQQRRQLVRSASRATRALVRRQGAAAARAVPRIVRTAQRAAATRRIPVRAVPTVVRRVAQAVIRRPTQVRRLARPLVRPAARVATRVVSGATTCAHCRGRHMRIRGPVTIHISR